MRNRTTVFLLSLFLMIVFSVAVMNTEAEVNTVPKVSEPSIPKRLPLPDYIQRYLAFIDQNIDSTQTVGAALTIVQGDQVIVSKGYGVRKAGEDQSVDEHTVFRLASVSKGFAGVLACLLEEDSIVRLDDKIMTYLPEFKLKTANSTENLSLKHTLSHTSGLVPHAYDNLIEENISVARILEKMDEVDLSASPGEIYSYQNVVFSIIDTVLRKYTGRNYGYHLQERIFQPLGMIDASVNYESLINGDNVAHPHVRVVGGYASVRMNNRYYNLTPAAGINASINDLSKWLRALLGNRQDIMSKQVCEIISTPQIITPLKWQYTKRWGKLDEKYYSLGWRIYDYQGKRIVYHGGYVRGYRAEIAFCPEYNLGIAFLQNSPNRLASQCIPTFFNYLFDELDNIEYERMVRSAPPSFPYTPDYSFKRTLPNIP